VNTVASNKIAIMTVWKQYHRGSVKLMILRHSSNKYTPKLTIPHHRPTCQ